MAYQLYICSPTPSFINTFNNIIKSLVWQKKSQVSIKHLQRPPSQGGISLCNLKVRALALKSSLLIKALSSPTPISLALSEIFFLKPLPFQIHSTSPLFTQTFNLHNLQQFRSQSGKPPPPLAEIYNLALKRLTKTLPLSTSSTSFIDKNLGNQLFQSIPHLPLCPYLCHFLYLLALRALPLSHGNPCPLCSAHKHSHPFDSCPKLQHPSPPYSTHPIPWIITKASIWIVFNKAIHSNTNPQDVNSALNLTVQAQKFQPKFFLIISLQKE